MGMTTIRLEEDLQARIAAAADREGRTAHAFMVEAITHAVERSESGDKFMCNAEERLAVLQESGKSVAFDEARAYLEARARGLRPARPSARQLAD